MIALLTLLSIVAVSIVVVRVATKALQFTGLSLDTARFQAYSIFTGTGFTTEESEVVARHPVRRRIAMILMFLRNAGLVTAISTLVLSFVDTESSGEALRRGTLLGGGMLALALLARSKWVELYLERVIEWALSRYTNLRVRDYSTLMSLEREYSVARFKVQEGTWLADKRLNEVDLPEEGILVLGIIRADGSYVGAPRGHYTVHVGDTLVLYGKEDLVSELEQRLAGSEGEGAHERAKREHERELQEQEAEEQARESQRADAPEPEDGASRQ